jgi:hypothetical protein
VRTILPLFLLAGACLHADDRADIDHLVAALSDAKDESRKRSVNTVFLCRADAVILEEWEPSGVCKS